MAIIASRPRPTCKRCGLPLDLFIDPDSGEANFECNNGHVGHRLGPLQTDAEFWMLIMPLTEGQRAELFKGIK
jgi:hypothetical protein